MSDAPDPQTRYRLALGDPAVLARLAVIGAVVAALALAFVFTGGWLSPRRLTPGRMIDTFEAVNGVHPGFRRNHAKGVCATGYFDSSGAGARLSSAAVFRPGRIPVVGRFALAGGLPAVADSPKAVRSLAISFRPAGGQEWRTGMIDIPVFTVRTPAAFRDQLVASRPDPATGKPDPARMKAFLGRHPESARAIGMIGAAAFSSGFDNATYNGLNAFWFVDAAGRKTPVRWSTVPVQPFAPEPAAQPAGDNYLFDALVARLGQGALQWRLVAIIGQPGDPTDDATRPWPAERSRVDLGVLTFDHIAAEAPGNCRDINYDPLVLPDGIQASDDPLLSARSAAYAQSFTRRAGEAKSPSAVQPGAAAKGG